MSGVEYVWRDGEPHEVEPAALPEWLRTMLAKPAPPSEQRPGDNGQGVREGARNSTLASLAGTMRYRGMGEASILAALRTENAERCDPPLPEDEVARIAKSVASYAPAGGGEDDPLSRTR